MERDFLPQKEITEEGCWAKPLLSPVRAGLGRCKEKVFKKKYLSLSTGLWGLSGSYFYITSVCAVVRWHLLLPSDGWEMEELRFCFLSSDKFVVEIASVWPSTDYSTILGAQLCSRETDIVSLCRPVVHNELDKAPSNDLNLGFQSPLCEFLELLSVSCLRIYLKSFTGNCTLLITCEKPRSHGPNPARLIKIVRSLSYLNDALH